MTFAAGMHADDLAGRCQSCGMRMTGGFFGTNADGSASTEYCKFCFQEGRFIQPNLALEEMIQLSIENITDENRMPLSVAEDLARRMIPRLKRWEGSGPHGGNPDGGNTP